MKTIWLPGGISLIEMFNIGYSTHTQLILQLRRLGDHHTEYTTTLCLWLIIRVNEVHPWLVDLAVSADCGGPDGEYAVILKLKRPDLQADLPLHVVLWRDRLWHINHSRRLLIGVVDALLWFFCYPWVNRCWRQRNG